MVLASTREKIDSGNALLWTDVMPLQRLLDGGADAGDAGVEPDDDFVVRRAPVAPESFALRLAQRAAEARARLRGQAPVLRHFDWIGYRGPRGTFDTRSYYQALEPGLLPAGFFKDKIVLVGRSARTATELSRSQADLFNSPFGTAGGERLFPGVELQATLVDNYLTGGGLRSASDGWTLALTTLLLPVLLWASRRWHPAGVAALTGVLVVAMGRCHGGCLCSFGFGGRRCCRRWLRCLCIPRLRWWPMPRCGSAPARRAPCLRSTYRLRWWRAWWRSPS